MRLFRTDASRIVTHTRTGFHEFILDMHVDVDWKLLPQASGAIVIDEIIYRSRRKKGVLEYNYLGESYLSLKTLPLNVQTDNSLRTSSGINDKARDERDELALAVIEKIVEGHFDQMLSEIFSVPCRNMEDIQQISNKVFGSKKTDLSFEEIWDYIDQEVGQPIREISSKWNIPS